MRALAVAAAGLAAVVIASVATAAGGVEIAANLAGTSSGVQQFCYGKSFTVSGRYSSRGYLGSGTYTGTITRQGECGEIGPGFVPLGPRFGVTASFVFSAPNGSFTASGSGDSLYSVQGAHITDFPTTVALVIEEGTKRYQRASGTLTLTLDALHNGYDNSDGSIGSLTGSIDPAGST